MAIQNIKLVVVDGGKADGFGSGGTGQKKKSKLQAALNYNSTIKSGMQEAMSPATFFAVNAGIGLLTQTARQGIDYYQSDIGRRNGDGNYAAIVGRQIEINTDIASFASSALSGAAAGSALGPVGAGIGAVAGLTSAGINLGFRQAGRERTYAHEIFKEDNSIAYQLARTSYTGFTGRLR